jgi:hypothetical protein
VEAADGRVARPDRLALDDVAWAVVPDDRLRRVLLVGPGNVYLQNALSLLPNPELYGATPAEWPTTTGKDRFDLIVFDGFLPPELPDKPILAIAPPRSSDLGEVTGTVIAPPVGQGAIDEPLLRNVDLSRLHIAAAQALTPPDWARVVLPSSPDVPLLYAGLRSGLPTAVLAFDLRQSDLPLQVAFPILLSNLMGELLGLGQDAMDPLAPSTPVELALRPGVTGLRVTLPDGSVRELAASATGASSVAFVETQQLGVYRVEELGVEAPEPTQAAQPSAAASVAPGTAAGPAGGLPRRFAVDLFSAAESNIAPGDTAAIAALGTTGDGGAAEAGTAQDEWWPLVAAIVLVALMGEWLLYERDGARRIAGALRSRVPGRRMPRPAGGAR